MKERERGRGVTGVINLDYMEQDENINELAVMTAWPSQFFSVQH